MSAWKLPLFALMLATFIGTAAYAQEEPQPASPPVAAEQPVVPPVDAAATPPAPLAVPEGVVTGVVTMEAPATDTAEKPPGFDQDSLSPERREEMRKKREERFNSLSPEKKAAIKTKMKGKREDRFKDMSPEERQAAQDSLVEWFRALPLEKQDEIKRRNTAKAAKKKEAPAPVAAPVAAEPAPAPAPAVTAETPPAEPVPPPAPEQASPAPAPDMPAPSIDAPAPPPMPVP